MIFTAHGALLSALSLAMLAPVLALAADATPVFLKEESGPPPGFEADALNATQISVIDVYFQNEYLTSAQATFTKRKLTFAHPELILKTIGGLKTDGRLVQALKLEQDTHAELICPGEVVPYCEPLKADPIGIIFNMNQYRADLFIDPQFLISQAVRKKTELLPSSAGLSALSQENFFIAGSGASRAYSLSNTGVMGYQQSLVTMRSYLQQVHIASNQVENRFELQQLTLGYLQREQFIQMGMLNTVGGSDYITSQSLLGVSITNQSLAEAIGSSTTDTYSVTSVPVYLALPSTVRVKRGGALIYMTQLPAGKHLLDTRSFPSGSYDLILEIVDTTGTQTIQKLFFVKADQLPARGSTQYYFAAGVTQAVRNDQTQPFFIHPEYRSFPLSILNALYSLGYNYGVEANILVTPKEFYWSNELLYYGNQYQLSPSILVSNHAAGYGVSTHFSVRGVGADFSSMKMMHRSSVSPNEVYFSQQALTSSDFQMIGALTYGFEKTDLSMSTRWSRNDDEQDVSKSYNVRIARELYQSNTDLLSLSLTAMQAQTNKSISLTLNWNMSTPHYHGVSNGGYSNLNPQARQAGQDNLLLNTEWSREINFAGLENMRVAGRYHYGNRSYYYGGKTEYRSSKIRVLADMQKNTFSGGLGGTTYSGEFNTHVAVADGHWSLGYDPVWQSGALLTLSADENAPVDVFVDGTLVMHMKAGSPEIIYLAPFKTYYISIMPSGGALYQFDRKPQVVTLYQGNFVHLHWDLKHKLLLFAQIVDETGAPVSNALLESKEEFEATDEAGYLQADIVAGVKTLRFKRLKQASCEVTLPEALEPQADGFVQIDRLVCHEVEELVSQSQ